MLGTMLHPYELAVPQVAIAFRSKRRQVVEKTWPTPAILTSSWQSPDGRIGHLLVNIAETRQPLKVNLDARNAPAVKPYNARSIARRKAKHSGRCGRADTYPRSSPPNWNRWRSCLSNSTPRDEIGRIFKKNAGEIVPLSLTIATENNPPLGHHPCGHIAPSAAFPVVPRP